MADRLTALRDACMHVAERARHVQVNTSAIPAYAASLALGHPLPGSSEHGQPAGADREMGAAFWITLDAINFGSGWFPTLRKRAGRSGYHTIAAGLREQFEQRGAWSAEELGTIRAETLARMLGQAPEHELMALFADALRDLGGRIAAAGGFTSVVDGGGGSALALVETLAGWDCFADSSLYDEIEVPFLKRAQITAADLHRACVARFADLYRLTMFADNLVPHVLRLDGILRFDARLAAQIERQELLVHGSPEEVEIRACALHAVELIAAERRESCPAEIDQVLWLRGQQAEYKARPRHRCRCTAY